MTHELKTWSKPFEKILSGAKTFEFRKNDRGFMNGDTLVLKEYNLLYDTYSGREVTAIVTYILTGGFGLPEDYCIMSIKVTSTKTGEDKWIKETDTQVL